MILFGKKIDKQAVLTFLSWLDELEVKPRHVFCTFVVLLLLWIPFPAFATFAASLLGGFLLFQQIKAFNRRAAAAENTAQAMQRTAESTEKGNVAERFKSAIDHLSNESVSVRLGGIYALHHLAQEEENYRVRVFEILCAHIRQTTTDKNYTICPSIGHLSTSILSDVKPTTEIASLLTLLFISKDRMVYEDLAANLQYANLEGAVLSNSNLQYADLEGTNLQDAWLARAKLNHACLVGANMASAYAREANMTGAELRLAVASHVDFGNANLRNVNFDRADCCDSSFTTARNLKAEQFKSVQYLYGAKFSAKLKHKIQSKYPDVLNSQPPKDY